MIFDSKVKINILHGYLASIFLIYSNSSDICKTNLDKKKREGAALQKETHAQRKKKGEHGQTAERPARRKK